MNNPEVSSPRPLRLLISTGEPSGDLQGALLITALYQQAQQQGIAVEILALGGDRMAASGATLIGNTTRLGSVGLVEALPYILPTLQMQQLVKRSVRDNPPDAVILIDYKGPNIGVGRLIRRLLPHIPITYYIAPQQWVWSESDKVTQTIAQITDLLLAIFPLEAAFYQKFGIKTQWIGHPLLDQAQDNPTRAMARQVLGMQEGDLAIALLPASRKQELRYLLPAMLEAAQQIQTQLRSQNLISPERPLFWMPLSLEEYRPYLAEQLQAYGLQARMIPEVGNTNSDWQRRCALAGADLAISKSGTVNLELALMQVPQVVMYRVSRITAWIARSLLGFSIPFMSPVNLVEMKSIVPELLQEEASPERICQEALSLLLSPERRQQVQHDYLQMKQALGEPGTSDRAAIEILKLALKPGRAEFS